MRPRLATKADLRDVEALLRTCSLPVGGIRSEAVQFHVSRDKTGLLGCAGIEALGGKVGLIRGVAVAERARRAGLAALLGFRAGGRRTFARYRIPGRPN